MAVQRIQLVLLPRGIDWYRGPVVRVSIRTWWLKREKAVIKPFVQHVIPRLNKRVKSLFFHKPLLKGIALVLTLVMAVLAHQGGKP